MDDPRKLIHVPFCFYPDPVGGTEVYVEAGIRPTEIGARDHRQFVELMAASMERGPADLK